MNASALRLLLTQLPETAETIQASIESGEIDARRGLENDPALFLDFVKACSDWRNATPERRKQDLKAQASLAKVLCEFGAKPWHCVEGQVSAFEQAVQIGNGALVAWLGKHPDAPATLLTQAPRAHHNTTSHYLNANTSVTSALLDLGFDPHVRTSNGQTTLHMARNARTLELLLAAGVDPLACDDKGRDAKAHWDLKAITNEDRKAVDEAFARYLPVDPDALIAEFGPQWSAVGSTISKQRLKAAGIDPETAHAGGIGLAERVIAEALQLGLHKTRSTVSYRANGDPGAHRKWHKLILAAMRLCKVGEQNTSNLSRQAIDTLDLYLAVDKFFLTKPAKLADKPQHDPLDDLRALAASPRHAGAKAAITNGMRAIDRLAQAGLIDNGAAMAGWLLKMHSRQMTWAEWMSRDSDGQTLFMRLAMMATSEFNETLQGPETLWPPTSPVGYGTMQSLQHIPSALANEPHSLGVMAIMAARTRHASIKTWLDEHLDRVPDCQIDVDDPWLRRGVELLLASKDPAEQVLGQRLATAAQAVELHQQTPKVDVARSSVRL